MLFRPLILRLGLGWLGAWALLLPLASKAQCPGAAACTPGAASASALAAPYGMGIYRVVLGSLDHATGNYAEGYQDYSCTVGTTLPVGQATAIQITNGPSANENVRVWIDYNNDGTLADNELAFASNNLRQHAGFITPPATAVLGTRLRLRVAADYALGNAITPCSTPQYSQDEDYAVTLVAGASAPTAAFRADLTSTCSGCVQLTDQSANGPTSWRWDFGDNTSSTDPSPRHCYATAGTYQVTLTASNAAGSSTSAATTITYNAGGPVAASCAGLAATATCCGYGITQVQLGAIATTSADGSAGYQDFTCGQRTTLTAGNTYTLAVTTGGGNLHDTRAWLDFNNDGVFSSAERILEALATASPSARFTVPATAALGQPLRLRLVADGVGTNPTPCTAPTLGQVEDYTVTVLANANAPVADFTSSYVAGACPAGNTYTFTDQSANVPTAWQWSFSPSAGVSYANGTTAASQNPQVSFASAGTYAATLTARNAFGSSTSTKANYLLVQVPCLAYCASTGGYSATEASDFWIASVGVSAAAGTGAYLQASGNAGYSLAAQPVAVLAGGTPQVLTVTTNSALPHRTTVWIDYNHDGTFATGTGAGGEQVYTGIATSSATATTTLNLPSGLGISRMRVQVVANSNTPNPCTGYLGRGEVEDYLLVPTTALASGAPAASPALTLSPNPTADGRLQVAVGEPSAAGRYAVEVTNALGARLLRTVLPLRAGTPATLDLTTLPTGFYLVRLTSEQGQTTLRRVVRE